MQRTGILTALRLNSKDNVATALRDLAAGSQPVLDDGDCPELLEQIGRGHKFALDSIARGDKVIKYGQVIGLATVDVEAGAHVHRHNLEGLAGQPERRERP
ncbi:MAG: UxaA family hydrolase, partial [Hyphomicrobiaceae bacterium]